MTTRRPSRNAVGGRTRGDAAGEGDPGVKSRSVGTGGGNSTWRPDSPRKPSGIEPAVATRIGGCSDERVVRAGNRCQGRLTREDGNHVPGGEDGHRRARLDRRGAEVREKGDVLERQQAGMDDRLVFVDVEACAGDRSLAKGVGESAYVNDLPSGRVDQERRSASMRLKTDASTMRRVSAVSGAVRARRRRRPLPARRRGGIARRGSSSISGAARRRPL